MTQKSLGGHSMKYIVETGKLDHVTGDDVDIRIKKMEKEGIEMIERGKNLEVTNYSCDKCGRKFLLFSVAVLIVTALVIIADLYASGRLGMSNIGTSGLLNSGTNVGSGSGSQGKIDDVREDVFIPNALEVQFRITNRNYTDLLKSFDTQEFKNFSSTLEEKLSAVIITGEVQYNGKATIFLKILKLEPGSILCTFRIAWKFLGKPKGDRTPPLSTKTLQQILETTFSDREEPNFKEYEIALDSIRVYELVDKCRNKEMQCSNSCVFRESTLRFECTCPDQKILDYKDMTTCYNPTDEEKKEVKFKDPFFAVSRNDAILIQIRHELLYGKEASADDSEKVENATSTATTAHSKEEVGNTTVVSESGGFNGTLINATTGDDPGQNTTVLLTETSNDTTGSMNATKHNATIFTPDADFKVTNETTLHNETHHAPPFTINGTLVAEQPLLKVFTNSSWELPSQDFSDLRPGGSPGDARLQSMDMSRVNKSSFEVPPDY